MAFKYSKAVVRGIPASLPGAALRMSEPGQPVDLERARKQHAEYVAALRSLLGEVIELPADERYPDCVFVEDPVVVCGDTALITIPGHDSRRGETKELRAAMERLGLKTVEMVEPGRMDGGDVLFTGREFFVGISERTNEAGVSQLRAAFPYPVKGIPVREGLHLKSFMSMAGPDLIAIGMSGAAKSAGEVIKAEGAVKYQFLHCADDIAANCLYINGTLVHASQHDFPNSFAVFEKLACKKIILSASEMNKVDGCFTCCSVLIEGKPQD